jgi:UDP-glucose 4-epimerase
MRALVTGGAGFIGSHIVDLLVEAGHKVTVVDDLSTGRAANLNPRAHFHEVDVGGPLLLKVLMTERPDVVFHQAAQMSIAHSTADPRFDAQVNVLGLVNVLEACVASGVRKVVFASSGATYGDPVYLPIDEDHPQKPKSPYGITKMAAEHYLRYYAAERGLQYVALRYGNVYGPRQDPSGEAGAVAIFVGKLLAGESPTIYWDGEQVRDYVYVTDVARANLLAASQGSGCYCIGTGVGTSVNQLYRMLADVTGTHLEPRREPRRPGDFRATYFDSRLARADLGWAPSVWLLDGLRTTVESFRSVRRAASAVAG